MTLRFDCSNRMATQAKHLALEKGIFSNPNPRSGKAIEEDTADAVREFYHRDDISRTMPGKKDCLSVSIRGEKVKLQKRLILGNRKEIYAQFKQKYPEKKIGFSKFAMLRPKKCVLAGASGTHQTCVCTVHNNVKLMMTNAKIATLTRNEDVPLLHYSHALTKIMCNPSLPSCHLGSCSCCPGNEPLREMLEQCFDEAGMDEIKCKQWTTTDRSNMETMVQLKDEFLGNFLEKLDALKRHDFIAKQQANYLNERKDSLREGEFLVIADFSENFSFICQDSAQSFHWNSSSATIHPFIYYYKHDEKVLHGNLVVISDCGTHDTIAVHHFIRRLINQLKEIFPIIRNIVYLSDGCTGQYKNLKNFLTLCCHEKDFGMPAEWHFFATSHGKGPSDGIGGTIKREATKASLQMPYKDQILSPMQLFSFVESSLPGIEAAFMTAAQWKEEEQLLSKRFTLAKTIAGTQKLHAFQPVSETQLRVSEYSNSTSGTIVSAVKNSVPVVELESIQGYIAVEYNGKWRVAHINTLCPGTHEVSVNFLHPHGPSSSYVFPEPQDSLVVDVSDVLIQLCPSTATGRTYTLHRNDTDRANAALEKKRLDNKNEEQY